MDSDKEKSITQYNENKVVRVSQSLYQLEKMRWRMSTLGYRMLFAIGQSIGKNDDDAYQNIAFEVQSMFKYLGLDNNNDRYVRLAETLEEISRSPLLISRKKKSGARIWQGYAWITSYLLCEDDNYVQYNGQS